MDLAVGALAAAEMAEMSLVLAPSNNYTCGTLPRARSCRCFERADEHST
jgi:hypothetical protein